MSQNKKSFDPLLVNTLLREILDQKRKTCPVCGKETLPHWKFCPNDGEMIP